MAARCKHNNLTIKEYTIVETKWHVEDGVLEAEGYHDPQDIQDRIDVECQDCGLNTHYNRFGTLPKWLARFVSKAFMVHDDE